MPSDISPSHIALIHSSASIPVELIYRYMGATDIQTTEHKECWAYRIETSTSYDQLSDALIAIEIHIKARCFIPILDDNGSTNGKIILNPPEKRGPSDLLIPGMKRLSKELEVDFIAPVHGSEGKRKRGLPKTIYDEENRKRIKAKQSKHNEQSESASYWRAKAMEAKDETIKALNDALVLKEDLVRTQAALISVLQR
jgi:hypothetical protein